MFEPVLLRNGAIPNAWEIGVYESRGGYEGLKKAIREHTPEEIIDLVRKSGLRGRGGAGFPTGQKWAFVPKDPALPKYLCCNADEGEPGSFKDRELMEKDPHQLVEGVAISSYAIGARRAFIYLRGELSLAGQRLERALAQAHAQGYLGQNILGSGYSLEIILFRGAGAYICGEETALLESLEGNRPMPRMRPPFPATVGLYGQPTVIQNVETLCNVPHIVVRGPEWYASIGTPPANTGPKIFSLSGHAKRPGNYELPLGVTARELIYEHGGGIRDGRQLKAMVPGGTSAPMLTAEHLDIKLDFDSLAKVGSMLGTGGVVVMDEAVCIPHAVFKMVQFYNHESCGKCTPCREGTLWLRQILHRIVNGQGREEDLSLLPEVCGEIGGKVLCALGDAAVNPVLSSLKYFRSEYEHHIKYGRCPM